MFPRLFHNGKRSIYKIKTKRLSSLVCCENATLVEKYLNLKIDGDRKCSVGLFPYSLRIKMMYSKYFLQKKLLKKYLIIFRVLFGQINKLMLFLQQKSNYD